MSQEFTKFNCPVSAPSFILQFTKFNFLETLNSHFAASYANGHFNLLKRGDYRIGGGLWYNMGKPKNERRKRNGKTGAGGVV